MDPQHAITADPHAAPPHAYTADRPASPQPFTDDELDSLHKQDVSAGRAVVVLMCSIFLIGVLIYTIVAGSIILF